MSRQTILLITARPAQLFELSEELLRAGASLTTVVTIPDALAALKRTAPVLAIVDDRGGDANALDGVRRLIEVNAFIHTAVLSDATEEEFHRSSEGLGVIARLPMKPGAQDARRLLEKLDALSETCAQKRVS